MSTSSTRWHAVSAVITAGAAAAAVLGLAVPAGAAARTLHAVRASGAGVSDALAISGAQLWASRYNGSANGGDRGDSVAVSPDGGTVFVTGQSAGARSGVDYLTVAYNAATGARRWVQRYNGPGNRADAATSVAVSPGGGTVFVTGDSIGATSGKDYATVAYNAATGARRWVKRYTSPGNLNDDARSVAVSPDGGTVFVTGDSIGATSEDYATVAYSAATGAQRWVKRYNGAGNIYDVARSVAVSPLGGTVFVTGFSYGAFSGKDYATVAYNAATGAQRWVKRYNGPGDLDDDAFSVAVSPAGGTVFVTGFSYGASSDFPDYATVAYNAATGTQRWVKRYNGPGNGVDGAQSVAVSPTGGTVFVTGDSDGGTSDADYATVAYNAATGTQQWVKRYNGPGNGPDTATSVAVSPAGGTVFVTGWSPAATSGYDYATVAYNAATGTQQWVKRYNGPGNGEDAATSMAVSPHAVFVTGRSAGAASDLDYATVAYRG